MLMSTDNQLVADLDSKRSQSIHSVPPLKRSSCCNLIYIFLFFLLSLSSYLQVIISSYFPSSGKDQVCHECQSCYSKDGRSAWVGHIAFPRSQIAWVLILRFRDHRSHGFSNSGILGACGVACGGAGGGGGVCCVMMVCIAEYQASRCHSEADRTAISCKLVHL